MLKINKLFVAFFLICTLELLAINPKKVVFEGDVSKINICLAPLFKSSFGKEIKVEDIFGESITKLSNNESGKQLLARLDVLCDTLMALNDVSRFEYDGLIHISFKDGDGTCFAGKEHKTEKNLKFAPKNLKFAPTTAQSMRVVLNLDLTNKNFVFNSDHSLCSIIPSIKRSHDPEFCEIGTCFTPFWITVAHELIHMEHFLTQELNKFIIKYIFGDFSTDDKVSQNFSNVVKITEINTKITTRLHQYRNKGIDIFDQLPTDISQSSLSTYYKFLNNPLRFHARYAKNRSMSAWESVPVSLLNEFPELQARGTAKKSLNFFDSIEERETVIGSRCSELTIRMAEEKVGCILPIRYLYQDSDTFFLEDISVMLNIINQARRTLNMPDITADNLREMLADATFLHFFNLGLCSHIVSQELLPDSAMKKFCSFE